LGRTGGGVIVTALSVTPVKAMRLQNVDSIELTRAGAVGNRRFFVLDERGRMINSKIVGELQTVVATTSDGRLQLAFPDGSQVQAPVALGDPVTAKFFSGEVEGRLVEGPWAEALSEHIGQTVNLVEAEGSVDRGADGAASLISRASLDRLASEAGVGALDARRFRMLIEIDGVGAHEEDSWVGSVFRVGAAAVRWRGHVGRCLTTSRDPDSGVVDVPTLDLLRDYRGALASTEPLPFGIYGEVVQEGAVRVGDELAPA
jgi:uncharacterized protein